MGDSVLLIVSIYYLSQRFKQLIIIIHLMYLYFILYYILTRCNSNKCITIIVGISIYYNKTFKLLILA